MGHESILAIRLFIQNKMGEIFISPKTLLLIVSFLLKPT